MRGLDEFPHVAETIRENREIFEVLSESDLSIAEYTRRALEWLEENPSEGGAPE